MILKQSQTAKNILILMVQATDHVSPLTGATVTMTVSKNGGAFGAAAGAVTEISSGWYKLAGNATDTNTLGALTVHATAAGADPADVVHEVVAFDPDDAAALGLSSVAAVLGKFTGMTSLTNWLRNGFRKGNPDPTATTEINATNGTGTGAYDPTTDAQEAIRDNAGAAGTGSVSTLQSVGGTEIGIDSAL